MKIFIKDMAFENMTKCFFQLQISLHTFQSWIFNIFINNNRYKNNTLQMQGILKNTKSDQMAIS
jgi:hypothetical protein